jgi:protein-S-isoprenylcysteine O-methyltransferase Ste14
MRNPKVRMWLGLVMTSVVIGLALFFAAGTIKYWQAWVYLVVGAVSGVLVTLPVIRDPILLEGRAKGGPTAEKRAIQKIIVWCTGIPAIATFVVPGLDRRFGWSNMPSWVSIAGDVLIIISMWVVFRVFKANSFGSATVQVAKDQRVISTGPYAIVRHPMYSSAAVYFIGMSLALGSYWGLVASVFTIFGFVWRLLDEEKFLAQNLPGYTNYCAKVRWHLVPGIF